MQLIASTFALPKAQLANLIEQEKWLSSLSAEVFKAIPGRTFDDLLERRFAYMAPLAKDDGILSRLKLYIVDTVFADGSVHVLIAKESGGAFSREEAGFAAIDGDNIHIKVTFVEQNS